MSSWCTQGHLYLLPLCWRNDFNICMDIILSHRTWGQYGVMEQCVILQYCVVSKHRVLFCDDQYCTWKLGNLRSCWFSFCVVLIYCLCGLFICSSALTIVVLTLDMHTSSLCFLKFWGLDILWPVLAMACGKLKVTSQQAMKARAGGGRFIAVVFL